MDRTASNGKDKQIELPALKSQTLDSNPNPTQPRIKFDQNYGLKFLNL